VHQFRYRDLDELRDDARHIAPDVAFVDDIGALARPLAAGDRRVGNRLVVQPMEGCDGNLDGTPGELTHRRWRRFAAGGAAVLWGEATAVVPEGRANPRQLLLTPDTAPALRALLHDARAARRERLGDDDGFVVGLQLTHSGRWSHLRPFPARRLAALDAVRGADAAPVTDDDLERLEERYVAAAVLARDIGFDFVDIKQCHTYLLNELLGARERPGRYGGDFEGRTRFVRNVFARIRDRIREGLLLATRINVYDGVPYAAGADGIGEPVATSPFDVWGAASDDATVPQLGEPLRLIAELRAAGLAMVSVTMGSPYYNPHLGRPFERPPVDGYLSPEHPLVGVARHVRLTAEVQRAFPDLPVVGAGYSWLRHYALHAGAAHVADARVSLVGLGRGALAYPDFALDALEGGGMQRDKACIGVSYCTALMRAKHNDVGQYAAGCVPRDRLYAELFRQARDSEGWR